MFTVHCGTGNQKLRWLSDVALHRYDPECCLDTGLMAEMRFENGVQLSPEGMIADELTDDVHIYLVLLGRYSAILLKACYYRGPDQAGGREGQEEEEVMMCIEDLNYMHTE